MLKIQPHSIFTEWLPRLTGGYTLCSEKNTALLFSCITLRKGNQFEWKLQRK